MSMATLKELREQAGLSLSELARKANIDYKTAKKADDGSGPVLRLKAINLLTVINQALGTHLRIEEVDNLKIM